MIQYVSCIHSNTHYFKYIYPRAHNKEIILQYSPPTHTLHLTLVDNNNNERINEQQPEKRKII